MSETELNPNNKRRKTMIIAKEKINELRTAIVEKRNNKYYVNDGVGYVWDTNGKPFVNVEDAIHAMHDAIKK